MTVDCRANKCQSPFSKRKTSVKVAGYLSFRQHLDQLILSNNPVRGGVNDVVRVHERLLGMGIAGEDDAQFLSVSSTQARLIGFSRGPSRYYQRQEGYFANERNVMDCSCHEKILPVELIACLRT
jgi:hypothetical protein